MKPHIFVVQPIMPEAVDALEAIGHDKKHVAGRLHFVFARGIGATETAADITLAELRSALTFLGLRA